MRHTWMDSLRGLAILLIVILHAVALPEMVSGVVAPPIFSYLNAAVTPYRMPMLMVLSGMLLGRALAKPAWPYARGKIRTLVWPYLVWVIVYWIVTAPAEFPPWEQWVATSWLWYIAYLAAYFAIAPALVKLPKWIVPIGLWTISAVVPDPQWTTLFLYAGYFFAGNAIWVHREKLRRFEAGWLPIVAGMLAVALSAAYVMQTQGVAFLIPLRNEELIYAPATMIGVGSLVLLARCVPERVSAPLRYFGRNSIVFYLVHYPLQIAITVALASAAEMNWRYHVGLGFIAPIVIGIALVALRRFALVDAFFVMPWPKHHRVGARASAAPA